MQNNIFGVPSFLKCLQIPWVSLDNLSQVIDHSTILLLSKQPTQSIDGRLIFGTYCAVSVLIGWMAKKFHLSPNKFNPNRWMKIATKQSNKSIELLLIDFTYNLF